MKKYVVIIVVAAIALAVVLGRQGMKTRNVRPPAADPHASAAPPSVDRGTSHPPAVAPDTSNIDYSGIEKPVGGKTIADLYAEKSTLSGKEVVVRGKVVKFTPNVMGKNWIHIRDGTGADGTNDLTVTTGSVVKIGDTVLVRGAVTLDRDLGFGYVYEILVENAEVTVE